LKPKQGANLPGPAARWEFLSIAGARVVYVEKVYEEGYFAGLGIGT